MNAESNSVNNAPSNAVEDLFDFTIESSAPNQVNSLNTSPPHSQSIDVFDIPNDPVKTMTNSFSASNLHQYGSESTTFKVSGIINEACISSEDEPVIPDTHICNILKDYIQPLENNSDYSQFECQPKLPYYFPKFEQTKAAEILANFVNKQFGITPTFAPTTQKQNIEVDISSFFSAQSTTEPADNDDFLLSI